MWKKKKQEPAPPPPKPQEPANPVFTVARRVMDLLQNKLVASLMLFGQGILFLVAPSGDMSGAIRMSAGVVILACIVMIVFHLKRKKPTLRNRMAAGVCGALIPAAAFFLYKPEIIEPYVKIAVGGVTIVMGLVNLIQTLKIEKKKDWKFVVSVAGAVAMMALGVFMIVADEAKVAVAQRSIGAILMLNALANIWYMAQLHRKTKEMKKEVKKAIA